MRRHKLLTCQPSDTGLLTVQRGVQFSIRPSGERILSDALAIGLRFEAGL